MIRIQINIFFEELVIIRKLLLQYTGGIRRVFYTLFLITNIGCKQFNKKAYLENAYMVMPFVMIARKPKTDIATPSTQKLQFWIEWYLSSSRKPQWSSWFSWNETFSIFSIRSDIVSLVLFMVWKLASNWISAKCGAICLGVPLKRGLFLERENLLCHVQELRKRKYSQIFQRYCCLATLA